MVKKIIWTPERTFNEFALLPDGLTTRECVIDKVNLAVELYKGLTLKIPLWSAAMMSVTGYHMCLELGKRGGIGILPNKLPVEEQARIVKKIKSYDLEFVKMPVLADKKETIGQVIRKIEQHGHSTIPVVDEYRNFIGMFVQKNFWESGKRLDDKVTEVMIPFNNGNSKIEYLDKPDVTVAEVKSILKGIKGKYLVVIDNQSRFVKLAFKQDIEDIKVGAAISTYPGWQERVAANIEAGVDLIAVDTSDAFNVFVGEVLQEYKKTQEFEGVPICAGNVVTYKGVRYLIEMGADMVKLGMSSGSICSTKREKATGRAPVAAFLEADRARMDWYDWSGEYIPLIWDGGAARAADWIIALTVIDSVMCGGYLNHFYEAEAEKYDADGKVTTDEAKMVAVATWGEGSARGINMDRYGQSRRTFFTEGEEGTVPYLGRMKPNLEMDLNKVKAALSNAGCKDLYEFRQESVIAVMSLAAQGIVGDTHSMKSK